MNNKFVKKQNFKTYVFKRIYITFEFGHLTHNTKPVIIKPTCKEEAFLSRRVLC